MINLHESMGPSRDRTHDPWICSQTRIYSQTRYRLRYAAQNEGGIPIKCPICLLFIRLDYKIWYQIKVETLPFKQNY